MHELRGAWSASSRNFSYVPVLSDASPEDDWTGRTGFVHRAVMQDLPDLSGYQVYACGAPAMVDAARSTISPRSAVCRPTSSTPMPSPRRPTSRNSTGAPRQPSVRLRIMFKNTNRRARRNVELRGMPCAS